MRTYGRTYDKLGKPTWVKVETDAAGHNDYVYVTALRQVLKLSTGESPFFANYGIPAQQSVIQQVFPDYYVAVTQNQFAPFFAALIVSKRDTATPTYDLNITLNVGTKIAMSVPG